MNTTNRSFGDVFWVFHPGCHQSATLHVRLADYGPCGGPTALHVNMPPPDLFISSVSFAIEKVSVRPQHQSESYWIVLIFGRQKCESVWVVEHFCFVFSNIHWKSAIYKKNHWKNVKMHQKDVSWCLPTISGVHLSSLLFKPTIPVYQAKGLSYLHARLCLFRTAKSSLVGQLMSMKLFLHKILITHDRLTAWAPHNTVSVIFNNWSWRFIIVFMAPGCLPFGHLKMIWSCKNVICRETCSLNLFQYLKTQRDSLSPCQRATVYVNAPP